MIPNRISDLSSAPYKSFIFLAGMQLDVFSTLSENQTTAKQLADIMNLKENHIERLLYGLVSIGLLKQEKNKFMNTTETEQYLVKGNPDYLGNHVYVNPGLNYWNWGTGVYIADSMKSGKPHDFYDFQDATYEQHLEGFRETMPVAVKAGEELAEWFDFSNVKTVVDIGGASGGLAMALKKAYPHLSLRVDDLPSITPVTETILKEHNASEIEVNICDIAKGPLTKPCDIAIMRAVIQVISPEDARIGIKNVAESINSGGYLMILGHILDDSKVSPIEEVGMNLIYLNWGYVGGCYTRSQYYDWIHSAGLDDIVFDSLPNGDRILKARKQ
jgi:hypothetical protein